MENVISRYRNFSNIVVLVTVLFLQIIGLGIQVKRPKDAGSSVRLIRVWAVTIITPFQRGVVHSEEWVSGVWHNYFDLRNVRSENGQLKDELARMRLEQVRLIEDANQARRLQLLLGFKEQYMSQTMAAQVIGTTGSEFSRGIYIDKGSHDGVKPDMPVITPDGIVGKVLRVFPTTSLVLMISDPTSGAGVILEKSRLQGILKGTSNGDTIMHNVMSDEKVEVGERILTSGGDGVFPKGLPVGTVAAVAPGPDLFLNIRVKPAAQISRVEEVLVITRIDDRAPAVNNASAPEGPIRAIDILAQRLPSVPPPPKTDENGNPLTASKTEPKTPGAGTGSAGSATTPKPAAATPTPKKPADSTTVPKTTTAIGDAASKPKPKPPTTDAAKATDPASKDVPR